MALLVLGVQRRNPSPRGGNASKESLRGGWQVRALTLTPPDLLTVPSHSRISLGFLGCRHCARSQEYNGGLDRQTPFIRNVQLMGKTNGSNSKLCFGEQ